ncbi:MAG: PIN domain-containing protein [Gammaproteobacteria bacterium]|nr:PIN domain-containing protein [Gammaproteobacteria bacterium]
MTSFLDTNMLVYAQGNDAKSERAREVVLEGGVISVQVLNEFTSVMYRKFRLNWNEIAEAIQDVKSAVDTVLPIDLETHSKGVQLAQEQRFNFYDALIIASALQAGCAQLITEDLQAGRRINGLTIVNPFLG